MGCVGAPSVPARTYDSGRAIAGDNASAGTALSGGRLCSECTNGLTRSSAARLHVDRQCRGPDPSTALQSRLEPLPLYVVSIARCMLQASCRFRIWYGVLRTRHLACCMLYVVVCCVRTHRRRPALVAAFRACSHSVRSVELPCAASPCGPGPPSQTQACAKQCCGRLNALNCAVSHQCMRANEWAFAVKRTTRAHSFGPIHSLGLRFPTGRQRYCVRQVRRQCAAAASTPPSTAVY